MNSLKSVFMKKDSQYFQTYLISAVEDIKIFPFKRTGEHLQRTRARRLVRHELTYLTVGTLGGCAIIDQILALGAQEMRLVTSKVEEKGYAVLHSLKHFACNFELAQDLSGILCLVSADETQEILFDWDLLKDDRYEVTVEVYGKRWVKAFQST